ncbi:bacterial low temperature requirement A protein-domain-containing protein [Sporodiniella umbellata]|nr:bacterial low temperature requirement A protein-domain-containing protein [Sporodiniella umbellata]
MSQDPRGTQGPSFRGSRRPSQRRSQVSLEEEPIRRRSVHSFDDRSLIGQHHAPHVPRRHEQLVTPLHDPAGKPLKRHGTETIGDVLLHPLKEMRLHHQREEAYESEKREWNEKHPEAAASAADIENLNDDSIIEEIQTRIFVHFRHLVGDQDVEFTEKKIEELRVPLELTEGEMATLREYHETDQFIDFLERTKRVFSVKVHKTVDLKTIRHDSSNNASEFREKIHQLAHPDETRSLETPGDAQAVELSTDAGHRTDTVQPGTSPRTETTEPLVPASAEGRDSPDDIFIELNKNVYLQIKYIRLSVEHETKQRRAFFLVPDPDLSDEIGLESSATWVELLGDVFYVGWLSNFTHATEIESPDLIGKYVAWFVVMWWTWCSSALYSSRYDSGDVVHHIYKIIELCGLIIMAGSSPTYDTSPRWFIIGYIIMKSIVLFQYAVIFSVSLGAHFKSSRRPLGAYVAVSAIAILLWGISLRFVSPEDMGKRYALWYVSIGLELVVHLFLQTNSRVSLAASHLGERFGLFTLIILGENCMGFIAKVAQIVTASGANANPDPSIMAALMFSVAIIFCYFFMYFDDFSGEFVQKTKMSSLWMYLHFPLHLVQVAFGIALINLIDALSHSKLKTAMEVTQHAVSLVATEGAHEASEEISQSFIVKFFWVTAGLILCFNAFIKLVNTPVKGAHHRSHIICASRIINAIIFFALSATTFDQLGPLSMIAVMMCCLLFQSAVDLLD